MTDGECLGLLNQHVHDIVSLLADTCCRSEPDLESCSACVEQTAKQLLQLTSHNGGCAIVRVCNSGLGCQLDDCSHRVRFGGQ